MNNLLFNSQCSNTLIRAFLRENHFSKVLSFVLDGVLSSAIDDNFPDSYQTYLRGVLQSSPYPTGAELLRGSDVDLSQFFFNPEPTLNFPNTFSKFTKVITSGSDFNFASPADDEEVKVVWGRHGSDRPSEGGIVERPFKTFNTELFSTLRYTGSNVQERPEDAEKAACLTLRDLEKRLVRYIVDHYNQRLDARMGDQTRFQRWESGLIATPDVLSERDLDICLMKQARRRIQRGGYLQFENLMYAAPSGQASLTRLRA